MSLQALLKSKGVVAGTTTTTTTNTKELQDLFQTQPKTTAIAMPASLHHHKFNEPASRPILIERAAKGAVAHVESADIVPADFTSCRAELEKSRVPTGNRGFDGDPWGKLHCPIRGLGTMLTNVELLCADEPSLATRTPGRGMWLLWYLASTI